MVDPNEVNLDVGWHIEGFWMERAFVYEDISGTEYLWPPDRQVTFQRPPTNEKYPYSSSLVIVVPIIDLDEPKTKERYTSLEDHYKSALEDYRKRLKNSPAHLHYVRISGYPSLAGFFVSEQKCSPLMNLYERVGQIWREREAMKKKA